IVGPCNTHDEPLYRRLAHREHRKAIDFVPGRAWDRKIERGQRAALGEPTMRRRQPDLRSGVSDYDRPGLEPRHQRGLHQPLVAGRLRLVGVESDELELTQAPIRHYD